jgi:hypothetical protein
VEEEVTPVAIAIAVGVSSGPGREEVESDSEFEAKFRSVIAAFVRAGGTGASPSSVEEEELIFCVYATGGGVVVVARKVIEEVGGLTSFLSEELKEEMIEGEIVVAVLLADGRLREGEKVGVIRLLIGVVEV